MNKLVKRIIGATSACALVLGMVLGANALAKKGEVEVEVKIPTEEWFDYTSPSTNPTDFNNPQNYHLSSNPATGQNCPSGTDIRCKIKAQPSSTDSNKPDMSTVVDVESRAL